MSKQAVRLISLDVPPDENLEIGALLTAVAVPAANVVSDIRENIRNLTGGRMRHYERLVESAVEIALRDLGEKARAQGYDGVIGVKISHPNVVDGGVEIIAYGNGFRQIESATDLRRREN